MKGNQKQKKCFNLLVSILKRVMKEWPREVADKNMNEIEAAQKIIELAQEKQKKATHELETVHKEK